jgi:hypothetical protein
MVSRRGSGVGRVAGSFRAGAFVLVAAALAIGCGGTDAGDRLREATLETRIDLIEAQIKTRIGPALCNGDEDCRALPIGAQACGGPDRYLPYSVRATDEAALARLAEDHRRLSAESVAARGIVGVCRMVTAPQPYCERSAPLSCKLR